MFDKNPQQEYSNTKEVSAMFITFAQLVSELQRNISIQAYNVTEQQIISEIALLPAEYAPGDPPLRQDVVYICEFWQLKRFEPGYQLAPLICVVEPNADPIPIFFSNRSVAVVFGSSLVNTMLVLSNVVYNLGCKSSLITEISHSFLQCGSIHELMDEGFRALKNPILITDQDQKILCYTNPDEVSTPIYRDFVSSGFLPAGHPDTATNPIAWSMLGIPFVTRDSEMPFPVICKLLSVGNNKLGYLHVIQFHHVFEEQDVNIAELLGNLIAMELWRQRKNDSWNKMNQTQRFIRGVLDNQLGSIEDAYDHQKQLGLTFKPCLYAMMINVRRMDHPTRILFSDLVQTVDSILSGCHSLLYQNSVFTLIESDTDILDLTEYLAPLEPYLQKYGLICGVSKLFRSVFDLRNYGFQAMKAIELGSALDRERSIYLYQEYTVDYMMEMCLKRETADSLYPPSFLRLRQYCEKNGSALLETLDTYLKCGRNKSETAKALFVHLNTVKYRITQLQDIMGVDLEDDDTVLELMLAFRMLRHRSVFS